MNTVTEKWGAAMEETGRWSIGQAAARAGVSVRTLRHYDAIGLLKPSKVTQAGYRFYDEAAMARLEQILFFRELGFPLEEIRDILNHPAYDARDAMRRQKALLGMQRARIDAMIARLEEALQGRGTPRPEVFRMREIEKTKAQYAQEVRERWGETSAYAESQARTGAYGAGDWAAIQAGMDERMAAFADVRTLPPEDARVQALVADWQQYITDHFYACTDEILEGLGQMYEADERFRENIDRHGKGTAQCMARAIAAYCAARRK